MGVMFTGGPDRIYDKAAAEQPMPPKRPLGFCPPQPEPKPEQEPDLWEGDNA